MNINNQIVVTSVSKALDKARVSGILFLKPLYLFSVYNYYINNPEILKSIYGDNYSEVLETISQLLSDIKYKYPNEICNYKTSFVMPFVENTPPVVDNTVVHSDEIEYQFKLNDFIHNWRDEQNDSWDKIKIYPIERLYHEIGKLKYDGVDVTDELIIHHSDVDKLVFERSSDYYIIHNQHQLANIIFSNIIFQISDDNENSLFSKETIIKIMLESLENEPPTIEDIAINVDNRVLTTLTIDMFESTYSDPENDPLNAIKILGMSSRNAGTFLYNSNPITIGQIITRDEIINGALTHEGADSDSIRTDQLNFAVRDSGSFIWVE